MYIIKLIIYVNTGSFPGVKCGQGVLLTTHPLIVPRSWKIRAYTSTHPLGHTGPVTGSLYLFTSAIPLLIYKATCFDPSVGHLQAYIAD